MSLTHLKRSEMLCSSIVIYYATVFSDTKSRLIRQFPSHIVLYRESLSVSNRNFQKPFLFIDIIFYFVMEM